MRFLKSIKMNQDTLVTGIAGEAGIIATEIAIPHDTIQLLLQVVIGIITLVRLFKNPNPKK